MEVTNEIPEQLALHKATAGRELGATVHKTRHETGSTHEHLRTGHLKTLPNGDWDSIVGTTHKTLEQHFGFLGPRELAKPAHLAKRIRTVVSGPPHQVFDAFFQFRD